MPETAASQRLTKSEATEPTAAKSLHARAGRPNLFIKIPGTKEGLPAIEEAIFAGVPINVTLLFSHAHYVEAAEAFLRAIERRIDAGLQPDSDSASRVVREQGRDLQRYPPVNAVGAVVDGSEQIGGPCDILER
ncbi:MAG: transaldolase family protein [Candidatus Binatia bacterium]